MRVPSKSMTSGFIMLASRGPLFERAMFQPDFAHLTRETTIRFRFALRHGDCESINRVSHCRFPNSLAAGVCFGVNSLPLYDFTRPASINTLSQRRSTSGVAGHIGRRCSLVLKNPKRFIMYLIGIGFVS